MTTSHSAFLLSCVQDVPVLLTRGEFDEVSTASATQVAAALPSSGKQVATFKGSGSYMHIGESSHKMHCRLVEQPSRVQDWVFEQASTWEMGLDAWGPVYRCSGEDMGLSACLSHQDFADA